MLVKEQVGRVEVPFRMFDVVMRDQGMLNGVIVGNCCWERFWHGTEKGRIKGGGGHGSKGEGRKRKHYCFYKISFFKYTVPVCYHEVVHFCEVVRIRDGCGSVKMIGFKIGLIVSMILVCRLGT